MAQCEKFILRADGGDSDTSLDQLALVKSSLRKKQLSGRNARSRVEGIMDDRKTFEAAGKTIVVQKKIDNLVKIIVPAKDLVSSALSAEPYPALAIVGAGALLPARTLSYETEKLGAC